MTSLWRHLWPNYDTLDFKILTQCVKMLGERVLQVWRWYLQGFRRYRKKTRGGLEIAPPPPPSGARVNTALESGRFSMTSFVQCSDSRPPALRLRLKSSVLKILAWPLPGVTVKASAASPRFLPHFGFQERLGLCRGRCMLRHALSRADSRLPRWPRVRWWDFHLPELGTCTVQYELTWELCSVRYM